MFKLDKNWFEVLSELFVDLSAVWFTVAFIEPLIVGISPQETFLILTSRFLLGMVTLLLAKFLRDKARKS